VPSLIHSTSMSQAGAVFDLVERSVVVTGATSGIGEVVALGLAQMGMNVMAVGRRSAELDRVAALAREAGSTLLTASADVTDEAEIGAVMDRAVTEFGALYGVVANAGIAVIEPAISVSAADFRSVVDTNLNGAFLTARSGARRMIEHKLGAIVFTSSSFARRGFTDWSSYNASKAAVSMLAETLACEWAKDGVRVNAIAPTATLTAVNAALFADESFSAGVVAGIPGGRILQAAELILPVAFLLSPHNQMLIGQTLFVDGGQAL